MKAARNPGWIKPCIPLALHAGYEGSERTTA
jgi:hypothetical protein